MKLLKIVLCHLKILCYGVENLFKPNLGDKVIYNHKEYMLIQGVANPFWDLLDENKHRIQAHKNTFRKNYVYII